MSCHGMLACSGASWPCVGCLGDGVDALRALGTGKDQAGQEERVKVVLLALVQELKWRFWLPLIEPVLGLSSTVEEGLRSSVT